MPLTANVSMLVQLKLISEITNVAARAAATAVFAIGAKGKKSVNTCLTQYRLVSEKRTLCNVPSTYAK